MKTHEQELGRFDVKNASGEVIPPFAVMQVSGATKENGEPVVTVVKPDGTGRIYLLNGTTSIGSGAMGKGYTAWGKRAALDPAETPPTIGQEWGPRSGQWTLVPKQCLGGFTVVGDVQSNTARVRMVGGLAMWVVATLDANMVAGAPTLASVNYFSGPPGFKANPGDISDKVKLASHFSVSHPMGTKLLAIQDDPFSTPPTYELLNDGTGGGGGGDPALPDVDCTLEYNEDVLGVNLPAIAGFGLAVSNSAEECNETGTGGGYCCFYVDITCGLTRVGNKVGVDLPAIAGRGLVVGSGESDCSTSAEPGWEETWCCINVNIGCGLQWVGESGDQIGVDPLAIAGCGLKVGTGECTIDVDNEVLAGPGIVPFGACSLGVLLDSTYLSINIDNEITLNCNPMKGISCSHEVADGKLTITITPIMCDDSTGEECVIEIPLVESCS